MNLLQEYNWLFANGKFAAKYKDSIAEKIICYDTNLSKFGLSFGSRNELANPKDCTLIARPIADMSHDEIAGLTHRTTGRITRTGINQIKGNLINRSEKSRGIYLSEAVKLCRLGVYPFSQEHFENGFVIDARTLEEPV